jgi:3-dehydroquinate synthase
LRTVTVDLGVRSYPVQIGDGLLLRLGESIKTFSSGEAIIVTVKPVRALYGETAMESLEAAGIRPECIEVPDGEAAKSIETFTEVVGRLLELCAARDSTILSLGGGCAGDLAGFVAATYMRGIRLVHVPTSLLAQVDSSIGGKVAINHPLAKNLMGAIYQPKLVLSSTDLLRTLPSREIGCGVAELIKYGAILDHELFDELERKSESVMRLERDVMEDLVSKAVSLKAKVVKEDEIDSGVRLLLNFGHTVGHAIETAMEYKGFSHGEAVAVGMVAESRVAASIGMMDFKDADRLENLISLYHLPTRIKGVEVDALLDLMSHDKKVEAGKWRFSLPTRLGNGQIVSNPPKETVARAIRGVLQN